MLAATLPLPEPACSAVSQAQSKTEGKIEGVREMGNLFRKNHLSAITIHHATIHLTQLLSTKICTYGKTQQHP
ncbi:MAG: hypothetical protein CVT94_10405 [Bacteroidetes bacterium HGW-Bacteroidetes-11]|nr:MAG: hypothetical protein CVT94_10405 [Bacteroidetes bacterium HGW-Bacteroidetes-11]